MKFRKFQRSSMNSSEVQRSLGNSMNWINAQRSPAKFRKFQWSSENWSKFQIQTFSLNFRELQGNSEKFIKHHRLSTKVRKILVYLKELNWSLENLSEVQRSSAKLKEFQQSSENFSTEQRISAKFSLSSFSAVVKLQRISVTLKELRIFADFQ